VGFDSGLNKVIVDTNRQQVHKNINNDQGVDPQSFMVNTLEFESTINDLNTGEITVVSWEKYEE
jgi:hypothetical protein